MVIHEHTASHSAALESEKYLERLATDYGLDSISDLSPYQYMTAIAKIKNAIRNIDGGNSNGVSAECSILSEEQFHKMYITGSVYFISDDLATTVKIGWSRDADKRFKSIKTCTPFPVKLLAKHDKVGRDFEGRLHQRFSMQRQHLEWFNVEGDLLRYLAARPEIFMDHKDRSAILDRAIECEKYAWKCDDCKTERGRDIKYERLIQENTHLLNCN